MLRFCSVSTLNILHSHPALSPFHSTALTGLEQSALMARLGPGALFTPARPQPGHYVLDTSHPAHMEAARRIAAAAVRGGDGAPNIWNLRVRGARWFGLRGQHTLRLQFASQNFCSSITPALTFNNRPHLTQKSNTKARAARSTRTKTYGARSRPNRRRRTSSLILSPATV